MLLADLCFAPFVALLLLILVVVFFIAVVVVVVVIVVVVLFLLVIGVGDHLSGEIIIILIRFKQL